MAGSIRATGSMGKPGPSLAPESGISGPSGQLKSLDGLSGPELWVHYLSWRPDGLP